MAFSDRISQAWKKIKELVEQTKTKAPINNPKFTGEVNLPPNVFLENINGWNTLGFKDNETKDFGFVQKTPTSFKTVLRPNSEASKDTTLEMFEDRVTLNKKILVEGTDIKREVLSKQNKPITYPNAGVETFEGLTELKSGTYNLGNQTVFELGLAYWTLIKITDNTITGDWHILAMQNGTNLIWKGRTNNGTWQGWDTVFTNNSCPIRKAVSGYTKFPNGLIIQWGTTTGTGVNEGKLLSFPLAFTSQVKVISQCEQRASSTFSSMYIAESSYITRTNFRIKGGYVNVHGITSSSSGTPYSWIAIGY